MQTFLPYEDFTKSALVLDKKRCWKQTVEAMQIINILQDKGMHPAMKVGWGNHPAVKMWEGYLPLLRYYFDRMLFVSKSVHNINTKYKYLVTDVFTLQEIEEFDRPWWLGDEEFHRAMRSRLIVKDREYYLQAFREDEGFNDGKYLWPDNETLTFRVI